MFCPHASLEWWPHITCLYLFVLNIAEQKMFFFSWFIAISTEKNENKNVALSFEVSSRGHHVLFSLSRNEHRVLQKIYFPLITSGNVSLSFKESLVINKKIPSCNIGWKINKKVVNFGKWFLCQFSPKTWNFLHGAFLTPQKLEGEKVLQNLCMQRGEKRKKREEGVFHRQNGCQKIVLLNAMIFAFWTFVKNTLL